MSFRPFVLLGAVLAAIGGQASAQEVLPFPPKPSGSVAAETMQSSVYSPLPAESRLPADAPNILVILIDDAGPALPRPLGGEIATPTLERILNEGIGYNRFHTTAMCSPTRAALLTGRNAHRVSSGQITEFANDWDGYSGTIPKSSATVAEVLRNYGYATSAFGKWHNTPATETTEAGPFDYWPTGYGFEYFYGFLAGEASQWEPRLVRNTTLVHPEKTPEDGYHLTTDLADDAIGWLRRHKAFRGDQPFFMYWATGAIHGPHHVPKEFADRYAGKFDDGWDAYRERAFASAKEKGWIPGDAALSPRPETLAGWDSIPEAERPFQRRLFEVLAGFAEHTDVEAGRLIDELDALGYAENTLVLYIWGDNGSSAEGQLGSISELLAQNGIPSKPEQHIAALNDLGGLDVLGSPLTDNHHHAGWAWAGSTPYQGTKLVAAHLGGTRNPMAVRWPAKIAHDPKPRTQFHHVNDIVPTIYEVVGVTPPRVVAGVPQDSIDGISLAYTFDAPEAEDRKRTQYFEVMGSRSIYHDGWMASTQGPRIPWLPGTPDLSKWNPAEEIWELYDLRSDWSQARDLAADKPEKLAEMKSLFLIEATRNKVLPIGGGLFVIALRPDLRLVPPYTEWTFTGPITDLPEFNAPKLGNTANRVVMDVDLPEAANGVLYALGGFSGGLTAYMKEGRLCYEYNLFIISRSRSCSEAALPAGKTAVEVTTAYDGVRKPGGPIIVTMAANGAEIVKVNVPITAAVLFTANDGFDIGTDLGSPVGLDYHEEAPFAFTGTIREVRVEYLK